MSAHIHAENHRTARRHPHATPFSAIALSAADRMGAALIGAALLWLGVAWALDWLV